MNRKTTRKALRALALTSAVLAASPLAAQEGAVALPGELMGTIEDYDAARGVVAIGGRRFPMSPDAQQALSGAPVGAAGYRGLSVQYSVTEMPDGTPVVDRLGIVQP